MKKAAKISNGGGQRASATFMPREGAPKRVCVYDCRRGEKKEAVYKWMETNDFDYNDFLRVLHQEFSIRSYESFVLVTTDRTLVGFDNFRELQDGSTLHMLQNEGQALSVTTKEHITFTPHHDTLIRSGMYEYYSSQGKNSLPFAIAELIDNSLSATAKNTDVRTIEIRMLFDETLGKPAVIVLDNGCGMTSKKLNNWAVYRLSKFKRENSKLAREQEGYVRPDPVPRSLNSDISYFGIGGKQACFFIGNSTRVITRPAGFPDVHELELSQEEFERKADNKEEVYTTDILNRKPSDSSHVIKDDERFLHALIAEESGKESFTAVVITGVKAEHINFLKKDFRAWTRQLAHTYHYYIHGVNGNDLRTSSANSGALPKIEIQITLQEKQKCPCVMNLREVDDDLQTLYINAAEDTFEFKATDKQEHGTVEGIIRYHPFLFSRETYPKDPSAQASGDGGEDDDDDDSESGQLHRARGKRPIFECFWNGRLIPYTTVSEFNWCTWNKQSVAPLECYSRVSGALFTDDRFQVSNNKLTFTQLEETLRDKETIFTRVVNGQKQRGNIEKEFKQWLQSCHERLDKQIKFRGFKKIVTRTDAPTKKMQHPWGTFSCIEWDKRTYKAGQLIKSHKTQPLLYGTVVQFYLFGNHDKDIFATGGEVEIVVEPRALHDKIKTIPISKIDHNATDEAIKKHIDNDATRLPETLQVDWREKAWPQNAVRAAGTVLGPLEIKILNKKEESLSRMPAVGHGQGRRLNVELRIVQHDTRGDKEVVSFTAQYSANWGYAFKKIDNLTNLGKYTLTLNTVLSESNERSFGGRALPSYKLNFTIKEGDAEKFVTGTVNSTVWVGVPFNIPLLIKDGYDHPVVPPPNLKPELKCSGLDLSYEKVDSSGTTLTMKGVKARGKVLNKQQAKPYELKFTVPGLKGTQCLEIVLLPGKPHSLHVKPEDDPVTAENGEPVRFDVEVHDEAGNITANAKQIVRCQVQDLSPVATDCSSTGAGQLVTKPINVKIIKGKPQRLKVQFDMPSQKHVASVERELEVLPSTRVASMELFSQDDENLVLRDKEKIEWQAGGLLENLFYRLYDEAGREVPLTAEIASKIKVNWTAEVRLEDLVQGELPDIQVPTQVQEERFYQVSYQDQSVSVSFHIIPRPDEPAQLKATPPQTTARLGEILPGDINLELVDQFDNATNALTPDCVEHMNVKAEGVDKSAVAFKWQESSSSVLVTGIQFQSGTPGPRELCFTYRSYVTPVKVQVTAGVPAQLKLISEPNQPLQVLNDSSIVTPFVVQLCDAWGNPSIDQRVVVELRSSPPTLKVTPNVTSQPVNPEGKATFTVTRVSGAKGYYQLQFQGSFNGNLIPSPSVNLTVVPDPNKPVSLSVDYRANAKFPAGGKFPVFSVTVVSDEGSPMTTFKPACLSMWLWQGAIARNLPPGEATELKCSIPLENEKTDCYHFRDKEIPERVGNYTIQFSLCADKTVLYSNRITVKVEANQPVKLGPQSRPPTPVVSYSKAVASRTLLENMTLRIVDAYGNPAGQRLRGKVTVSIKSPSEDNKTLPLFEGRSNSSQLNMEDGKVHVKRLTIMENSPGEDGSSYILLFKPELSRGSTHLEPYELPFHFYNDVDSQRKISELTKKKNELTASVAAYKKNFEAYSDLLRKLTAQHLDASRKEIDQRNELNKWKVNVPESATVLDVDRLLEERTGEANRIKRMPRRVCSIPEHRAQQDVLGKVGHLAFVKDDAAARVISWHIQGDMDCVITTTTEAAMRIHRDSGGKQQLMALDSIIVTQGNRSLPHIQRSYPLFEPPGNPVFARQLLIYNGDRGRCDTVFKNILGDTILMDDLDSANTYRRAVVQHKIQCPTILTRQGDRISSRGKFGGANNKAPPMDRLRVFGAPYPEQYHTAEKQIELLGQYRSTLQKRDRAARERDDYLKDMKSPEMMKKQQDMKEKEEQLREIERQHMSTPVRPLKRGPEIAGEPSGVSAKRANQRSM